MLALLLTTVIILIILLINEWWWHGRSHGEISRKFVHITVGTFVAFWPYFLGWDQIRLLSLAFIIIVIASLNLNLFKAIHSVQRPTYGEIFFAMSVGLLTFITDDKLVYTAALLHMSLADGMAAIIGVKFGERTKYKIAGHQKSLAGTMAFVVVSWGIVTLYFWRRGMEPTLLMPALAISAAAIENVAVKGLDNLAVPVLVAVALSQL